MTSHSIRLATLAGTISLVWLAALAQADVRDPTGLFSPAAVQQAEQTMQQLRQRWGKDLVIEVHGEIPADLRGTYQPEAKDQFFANWARSRAQSLGVNGIYILINRNPAYLQVSEGQETRRRAFTPRDRAGLTTLMLGHLRQKQPDRALIEGTQFVQQTLQRNLSGGARPSAQQPGLLPGQQAAPQGTGLPRLSCFWIAMIVGGIALLIFFVLRRRSATPYGGGYGGYPPRGGYPPPQQGPDQPPPPPGSGGYGNYPPPGGYGGGGGFGRGLLGGILGGAAGGWLYDRLSRPTGQPPGQAHGAPPPPDSGASDQGQGFEGSGGSFDSGSGGGSDSGGEF